MTIRQLQLKAFDEWNKSRQIKQQFHTFEFYWWQKYARVYQLPSKISFII